MISSIETLIVTMRMDKSEELLERMNIQTDFVIGNQDDIDSRESISYKEFSGLLLTRQEVGVGFNRNTVLFNSTADICVLADDDMVFLDNYPEIVSKCFIENEKADVIIFNLSGQQAYEGERTNDKTKRINITNYMNYGAARIAFRRKAIHYKGISFNTCFGGGTDHQCGEDSLFIKDCLTAGLRVIAVNQCIASISSERESTWFTGYSDKYFFDKGVFLQIAHPRLARLFALYLVLRHKEYKRKNGGRFEAYNNILKGINYVKNGYQQ